MSDGPFLYSDVTIESPEFKKKPPSLHLSCQSSNTSLKSAGSTYDMETASIHSEESSGFKRGSDSGTVILCSTRNSQSSSFTMEDVSTRSLKRIQLSLKCNLINKASLLLLYQMAGVLMVIIRISNGRRFDSYH
ncbi:unnamed protein product [Rodentolepis nana]|uniref:Ovule protein n=1 Tax=Rodentolepis nana TaxID=102285 RepID=A0A0R3TDW1_RODNA|nr:unnamed protein product [Rodentolepis nana]